MKPLLTAFAVQARYWRRHRVQALLCLGGIVLGVAVFCAIQLANQGALRAFRDGTRALAGRATHRVFAPDGGGVAEAVFPRLAEAPGVLAAAPLLRERLVLSEPTALSITVLGTDPLSDAAFRPLRFLGTPGGAATDASDTPDAAGAARLLERFLAEPDTLVLSTPLAAALGVAPGDTLAAQLRGKRRTFRVLALFRPPPGQTQAFSRTALQDVAAYQEAFGQLGRLDAIQLVLAPGAEASVAALLPPGLRLEPAGARTERVAHMARAFQLNLEVLGGFALLVALFLIFNAASFSVVQRERTVAILRCIGATARTVFIALLAEALLVGAVGGVLGVLAGRALGALMLRNTGATLFEVVLQVQRQPSAVTLDAPTWALGLGLGMGVSLLGALAPAWAGARVAPLAAVRAGRGAGRRSPARGWALLGVAAVAVGVALMAWPGGGLAAGLGGATLLATGMAALCPLVTALVSRVTAAPLGRLLGAPGRMAARNLERSLARTGVAAASLMIALALALAIEITVNSFRHTFQVWMSQVLTADLYLEPGQDNGTLLRPELVARLRTLPAVADAASLRSRRVLVGGREVLLLAVDVPSFTRNAVIPAVGLPPAEAQARLEAGDLWVSESLAYLLGLRVGEHLALATPAGPRNLTIGAVVQNYSAPQGVLYLSLARFTELYGRLPPVGASVWLRPGADAAAVRRRLESLPEARGVQVLPNAALRGEALRIFDRTFAITDLMGALAAFVAFMAVVSALTALLEERMRSLGYLRAIGISRRALGASMAIEAALLAGAATVTSWVTGVALSWVLVFVVNRRAFGWTMQFLPGSGSYGRLLALALVAGLLGSAYPIWRATRLSVVATIREE